MFAFDVWTQRTAEMGAWGAGNFSNDTALDFVHALSSPDTIWQRFRKQPDKFLDADAASEVLAAADIVAGSIGRPAPDTPEEVFPKLKEFTSVSDAQLMAVRSWVGHTRERSELAELWREEEGQADEWKEVIDDLLVRLDPSQPYHPQPLNQSAEEDIFGQCYFCENPIPEKQLVELEHVFDDGVVYSTMTLYAHRDCVENKFDAPHWDDDGKPSRNVLRQFAELLDNLTE